MKEGELDLLIGKAKIRASVNLTLLGLCLTIFTFIVTINPSLLQENLFVAVQLVLAIPLFITSTFVRSKLNYVVPISNIWRNFGFVTFIVAYSFIINIIGILMSHIISSVIGVIFLCFNILLAILYSSFECIINKKKAKSRFFKDLFFSALIFFLGILPSLGVY